MVRVVRVRCMVCVHMVCAWGVCVHGSVVCGADVVWAVCGGRKQCVSVVCMVHGWGCVCVQVFVAGTPTLTESETSQPWKRGKKLEKN